jgi:hypothetical protein
VADQFAHYNVARLVAMPGDPRVAEFIDNAPRVNAVAKRSPGFVWRLDESSAQVGKQMFQALDGDPFNAYSLSVWKTVEDLRYFVVNTVHGGFLRRKAEWFEPSTGPSYVIWPVAEGHLPTMDEGRARLALLTAEGASGQAFDFKWDGAQR